jgi:hypothetical protein
MRITAIQNIKQVRIVVNPPPKKTTIITVAQLGKRGFKGESSKYEDIELVVTQDDQTEFNIFSEPTQSNLFINDSIYFKDKSYLIQNISGNWKLIWLNEFLLKTNDLLIFRKF